MKLIINVNSIFKKTGAAIGSNRLGTLVRVVLKRVYGTNNKTVILKSIAVSVVMSNVFIVKMHTTVFFKGR